jgi:protein SCO1/2
MSRPARRRAACFALLLAWGLSGCREAGHDAKGIVLWTDVDAGRVAIAVEAVPGVLPATDAEFVVDDDEALASLAPAQAVELSFLRQGASLRLIEHRVIGRAAFEDEFVLIGDRLQRTDPGFPFTLRDQQGQAFGLDDVRGRVVLLDFIFTSCHGPCPAQTQNHVQVQRGLSSNARARSWFVSISIDPETDDEAALREYAALHGVDLKDWSFLTGPVAEVERVVAGWQIGTQAADAGQIDHTLVSYLLDGRGRIVQRYRSGNTDPARLRADIDALVEASAEVELER